VTILFQDQNLFPHLTLAQNLGLGLRPDLRLTPAITPASTGAGAGRASGLGPRKPRAAFGRSGQPGGAGAGLASGPADPAAGRALRRAWPGPAAEMLDLVREVADETGALVLMVTHDPQDALALGGEDGLCRRWVSSTPGCDGRAFRRTRRPPLQDYLGRK
jgi:thiamine transport system ATP-binding protein